MTAREQVSLGLVAVGATAVVAAAYELGGPWWASAAGGVVALAVGALLGVEPSVGPPLVEVLDSPVR
jgi:hypothetical protein